MSLSFEQTTPKAIAKLEREIARLKDLKKKSDARVSAQQTTSAKYEQQIIIKKKLLDNHKKIMEHIEEIRKLRGDKK